MVAGAVVHRALVSAEPVDGDWVATSPALLIRTALPARGADPADPARRELHGGPPDDPAESGGGRARPGRRSPARRRTAAV